MGAHIEVENGYVHATVDGRLKGGEVIFDMVTVGGTENILMAAALADGVTTIRNAAREPEITDLAQMLVKMGAKIEGIDTDTLVVTGVESLHGCEYAVVADRIETGSYLAAAAITGGRIKTTHTDPSLLESVLDKFEEMGAEVTRGDDWIELDMMGKRPKAVSFRTLPHPEFPTDMQAQIMAVMQLVAVLQRSPKLFLKIGSCTFLNCHVWVLIFRSKVMMRVVTGVENCKLLL